MAFTLCRRRDGLWKCELVPVLLEPWWEWVFTPASSRGGIRTPSLLARIRAAINVFQDPPNPWREIGIALPVQTRCDLGILSTIGRISERLRPEARAVLEAALADAAAKVPLPAGAEVRWHGGPAPRSRASV